MPSFSVVLVEMALVILPMMQAISAAPSRLLPRYAQNYVDCSDTQKTKVETALADAAALANIAYGQFNSDRSSTAYTHYLREEDSEYALKYWSAVASNNDPTNPSYSFSIRCAASCTGGEANSLAVTDSAPQDGSTLREMKLCPLFFTATQTANNLDSKDYNGDKRGSWCQTGQKFSDFETAGHTMLHEMTHLDALGAAAGVPSRTDSSGLTSHGTDDVDGSFEDYVQNARELLDDWVNDPDSMASDALKPWQNAENIAAAATENWFLKSCGFTDISLS